MNLKNTKKGFTLVELLVAASIFAIFLTSIVTVIVDLYRSSRRITLEYQIYQDLRIMVKQISDILENSTIDYEEYYRDAVGGDLYTKSTDGRYVYGDYGKLFYDFGAGGPGLLGEGAFCQDFVTTPAENPGCVIDKTTLDRNMGKNPSIPILGTPDDANALCGPRTLIGPCSLVATNLHKQSQLYLINANGDRKTILGLEPIIKNIKGVDRWENALSIVWFNGLDTDSNDIPDQWLIGNEFDNIGGDVGNGYLIADLFTPKDESVVYKNFSPISPLRTNIVNLQFYISPLEDPYKAFAEKDPALGILVQPHVTLIMTVEPSASELTNYIGKIPRQTIQTTIYSKVDKEVRSY